MSNEKGNQFNLLIGVTGSVATIKLPLIIKRFKEQFKDQIKDKNLVIRVVATEASLNFFDLDAVSKEVSDLYRDQHEWLAWKQTSKEILHIELRKWADLLLIAPLDANTLAKLANGLCDNLLTCICRAWDQSKTIFFAPAMNTYMYDHPLTNEHLNKLDQLGYVQIPVIVKTLACGDTGKGAMEEYDRIVRIVMDKIKTIC